MKSIINYIKPKDFVTLTSIIYFGYISYKYKQILPLYCVFNSIKHHYLYPTCEISYNVDMIFNTNSMIVSSLINLYKNPYILLFCSISFFGWTIGQFYNGCITWPGAIIHSFFCQLPAAYSVNLYYK